MYTLGINAAFHDSAAVLIKDGQIIAAAEEERFTHIKHGKRPLPFSAYEIPYHAIDYCLKTTDIHLNDIENFAYSFDPELLKKSDDSAAGASIYHDWDELFQTYIELAALQLQDGYPHHLQKRFIGASDIQKKWHYVAHHVAHAASAYYPSPFQKAAIMILDGRGEKVSTSYYLGEGNRMTELGVVCMPHSLGMLYEKITTYLGFLHSSDEYKVMALASYGNPIFMDKFMSAIHLSEDGSYQIDDFNPEEWWGPHRKKDDPFTGLHFDIAHSLQKALETSVLFLVNWLHRHTQTDNLCLAGGVALNCVLNSVIKDNSPFKQVWVQPAAGDAGTALGAALWVDVAYSNADETDRYVREMNHVYWGPSYTDDEVEAFLKWSKVPYKKLDNVARDAANILAQNKIIGWYQGRMEFGPRALGSRSILASPIEAEMQAKLNDIKDREDFRPVAPVVLEEEAGEWFDTASFSPFMLFVYPVKEDKADKIPAVRHVDGTARIQTINRNQHPLYYDLLHEFKNITGVPVLVNTSFNTRGEPIVCTPRDAIECFWTSPFDALVINSFLLEK
ncbi:carbamoyltransferase C-terminal domain-containing protein [Emticicia sp. TH156]|uniref:carbamoyltransferase family protein n=1 Tax=Emticicia sp. TH156 TaxID=2067454 RepID=UPI000C772A18|nr:carbamoyltransferase C-terminal domain-containing protein [Emticicia sp. TH156]PLK42481.1 carbamoyltransferase [Emticicia sp. TH156]